MRIIGRGFIARHLTSIEDRHPDVAVLAAGVSSIGGGYEEQFARERELVRTTLEECKADGRRMVLFSTASHAMYGNTVNPAREVDVATGDSPYGIHKLGLESMVVESSVPHVVLRLSHVMGSGQRRHQLLPALIEQFDAGIVRVFAGAHRDIIDVFDVVEALDAILASNVNNVVVNVATGRPIAITAVIDALAARLGPAVFELVDAAPALTTVSVERMRQLAPGLPDLTGPRYLERLLDRHVPSYQRAASTNSEAV